MNKNLIIVAVLIILALGGGFFAGMHYQKSQATSLFVGANGVFRGRFGQGAGGQNFRPVRGQVLSIDSTGLTVKLMDGTSKIVVVSPSTSFVKSAAATSSDIKTGDTVMVIGAQNSDGSVTAQDVQINPPSMRRGQTPSGMPTGSGQ